MKRTLIGIYTLGLVGLLGSGVFAQAPNVPVFSLWATEVTDGMGGPNKCTSCPTQNVPLGEIAPGDVVRIEAFVSTWDAQPQRGKCDGDPLQGQDGNCTIIGDTQSCPGRHCANNGTSCATDLNCSGSLCVKNACASFPRVGAYVVTILDTSLASGTAGELAPYRISCDPADCSFLPDATCPCAHFYQSSAECSCATSNSCDASTNLCALTASAFIEKARPDMIFFGKATLDVVGFAPDGGIDMSSIQLNSLVDAVVDNGSPRQLGSLIMQASPDAADTFTVTYFKNANATALFNANAGAFDGAVYQDLILNFPPDTNPTDCTVISTANPTDCEVDGRQPHDIANAVPAQGITTIDVTFGSPCNAAALNPADFTVSLTPTGGTPPTITSVTGSGTTATLTFNTPIPPQKWTCVTSLTAPGPVCVGFLPGDVNANLTANTADVTAAINSLNGTVPEPPIATDTNRSSIHTAEDLVRLLDLFNGGGAYSPLLNTTLPACP